MHLGFLTVGLEFNHCHPERNEGSTDSSLRSERQWCHFRPDPGIQTKVFISESPLELALDPIGGEDDKTSSLVNLTDCDRVF